MPRISGYSFGRVRVLEQLRDRAVEVESLPTPDAIERFGGLDPGRTAAALHLTC